MNDPSLTHTSSFISKCQRYTPLSTVGGGRVHCICDAGATSETANKLGLKWARTPVSPSTLTMSLQSLHTRFWLRSSNTSKALPCCKISPRSASHWRVLLLLETALHTCDECNSSRAPSDFRYCWTWSKRPFQQARWSGLSLYCEDIKWIEYPPFARRWKGCERKLTMRIDSNLGYFAVGSHFLTKRSRSTPNGNIQWQETDLHRKSKSILSKVVEIVMTYCSCWRVVFMLITASARYPHPFSPRSGL